MEFDSEDALQEACEIDPAKLPTDVSEGIASAGPGAFRINHEPLLAR